MAKRRDSQSSATWPGGPDECAEPSSSTSKTSVTACSRRARSWRKGAGTEAACSSQELRHVVAEPRERVAAGGMDRDVREHEVEEPVGSQERREAGVVAGEGIVHAQRDTSPGRSRAVRGAPASSKGGSRGAPRELPCGASPNARERPSRRSRDARSPPASSARGEGAQPWARRGAARSSRASGGRYFSAFFASPWTVAKSGMSSSHS